MADVWEIAEYVEGHPDNYDQRWRLCKKLYTAWEYRLALEHLLILKNEWTQKVNVRRYLGATYYRLSRYEEAVSELEEAIEIWPGETGIREQLARAYDKAGRSQDAGKQWAKVLESKPDHPFAKRAVRSIKKKDKSQEKPSANFMQNFLTPAPMGTTSEVTCEKCGARNGMEFERCWQCRAPLSDSSSPFQTVQLASATSSTTSAEGVSQARPSSFTVPWTTVIGVGLVGLLTLAVYATLSEYSAIQQRADDVPPSVGALLSGALWDLRLVLGLVLLVTWPLLLRVAVGLLDVDDLDYNMLYVTGFFLAALTYTMMWWSSGSPLMNVAIPIVASLIVAVGAFGVDHKAAVAIWATQAILIAATMAVPVAAMHGFRFLGELPALARYAAESETFSPAVVSGQTPLEFTFTLHESDSTWLNELSTDVEIVVTPDSLENRMFFEVSANKKPVVFKQVVSNPFKIIFEKGAAGESYHLSVNSESPEPVGVSVAIRGIFEIPIKVLDTLQTDVPPPPPEATSEPPAL